MVKAGSWHPLHSALIFGELDKAKTVFEKGKGDPGMLAEANDKGWTALHFAAHSGNVQAVRAPTPNVLLEMAYSCALLTPTSRVEQTAEL